LVALNSLASDQSQIKKTSIPKVLVDIGANLFHLGGIGEDVGNREAGILAESEGIIGAGAGLLTLTYVGTVLAVCLRSQDLGPEANGPALAALGAGASHCDVVSWIGFGT
jgi:hypothetical protein